MDKKLAGLLGAAAALSAVTTAQAAPASGPELPQASSYRDLLDPIPNALMPLSMERYVGDRIMREPPGFQVTARSDNAPIAGFENRERGRFGILFHPEVTHTEAGTEILRNFLFRIAGCKPTWDLGDYRKNKVREIRATVGKKKAIAAVSGGVDSTVAALLVAEAIGDLPRLRSGLSKERDSLETWREAVLAMNDTSWMRNGSLDEDMRNALRRIELHEIPFSAPSIASSVEQVLDDVHVARINSHLPDRHLHPSLLGPVRIGVGNDKDSFGSFGAFGAFGSFESFGSFSFRGGGETVTPFCCDA